MEIQENNIQIDPETKSFLMIQENRIGENGESYVVSAFSQTDKKESLRSVIKNSFSDKSPEETSLASRLKNYIELVSERETEEFPSKISVSVSKCNDGKVLSTEQISFTLEEFQTKQVHLPKPPVSMEKE